MKKLDCRRHVTLHDLTLLTWKLSAAVHRIAFQSSSSTTFNKTCSYSFNQDNNASTIDCKIELASKTLYPTYIINNATG